MNGESAQLFANFCTNEVEEEDEIEKALNKRGCEVHLGKEPKIVGAEKKYCRESHGPCPAEEHEQSPAGSE